VDAIRAEAGLSDGGDGANFENRSFCRYGRLAQNATWRQRLMTLRGLATIEEKPRLCAMKRFQTDSPGRDGALRILRSVALMHPKHSLNAFMSSRFSTCRHHLRTLYRDVSA